MKRFSFFLLALGLATAVSARPAKSEWRTVTQSDGTSLRVTLCGDERFHFYMTEDNVKLVRMDNGDYHYANTMGFALTSTGILAHEAGSRTAGERRCVAAQGDISQLRQSAVNRRSARRQVMLQGPAAAKKSVSDGKPRRGLVIMAKFTDKDFSMDNARQVWGDILNKEGYSDYNANGSVHDYFLEQSNGMFNLTFDLVGPVAMPKSHYYYGKNSADGDIDINAGELVAEACKAVVDSVDFRDYDWDGDGYVDQVFILYAGCGEAVSGADSRLLWPHEYQLSAYAGYRNGLKLDGVTVNTYAIGSELEGLERNSYSNPLTGLGTFCHEFSHCLGLPDVYDTSYSGGLDMLGSYDLMSAGWDNGSGFCPPNYTAYERKACGWQTPVELIEPVTVTGMRSLSDKGETYQVTNECDDASVDEYFLIENRQKTGWDREIPGKGVMISRVNYNEKKWFYNTVNNDRSDLGIVYFPANNRWTSSMYTPYPYSRRDSLTDTSSPKAEVYNLNKKGKRLMGKPITKIAVDSKGLASFDFCGGSAAAGISGVAAGGACSGLDGMPVTVYDEAGRKVAAIKSYRGLGTMPKGIYIVKGRDKTVKVVNL